MTMAVNLYLYGSIRLCRTQADRQTAAARCKPFSQKVFPNTGYNDGGDDSDWDSGGGGKESGDGNGDKPC